MDIKNIASNLNIRAIENQPQTTKNNETLAGSAQSTGDKVTISSSVQNLEQQAKISVADNSVRIDEIKHVIKDGSYQVNAEKVATSLIANELLLAGA